MPPQTTCASALYLAKRGNTKFTFFTQMLYYIVESAAADALCGMHNAILLKEQVAQLLQRDRATP